MDWFLACFEKEGVATARLVSSSLRQWLNALSCFDRSLYCYFENDTSSGKGRLVSETQRVEDEEEGKAGGTQTVANWSAP